MKINKKLIIFICIILLFQSIPLSVIGGQELEHSKDYYVSVLGNDNNLGIKESPFRTIARAASLAEPGTTVYIREGTYREGNISPANSGTAEDPITFTSYNNEQVIISGTDIVPDNWTLHSGNIYKVQLDNSWNRGKFRNQIFYDGQMMYEARWPNIPLDKELGTLTREDFALSDSGGFDPDSGDLVGFYTGHYQDQDLNQFSEGFWTGGYVYSAIGYAWGVVNAEITSSSPGRIDFSYKRNDFKGAYDPQQLNSYFLWGKLEALDVPGEWFFDESTKLLYFYAPDGNKPTDVEMKKRDSAFFISGKSHIQISNVDISASRIFTDSNSSHITIDNISLIHGSGDLLGNTPSLGLRGNNHMVTGSYFSKSPRVIIDIKADDTIFINNVVEGAGYYGNYNSVVETWDSRSLKFFNNSIFNSGVNGISATAKNSKFYNNRVFNIGLIMTDLAGINAYGGGNAQGTEIAYNMVHDIPSIWDPENKFYGGKGIRLDAGGSTQGPANYIIHHNIITKTSSNSIAIWGLNSEDDVNSGKSGNRVYNNTMDGMIMLVNNPNYSIAGTEVINNIAPRIENAHLVDQGATITNNLFTKQTITGNLAGSAHFVNAANHNFMLKDSSPAIDSGLVLPPYTDGYIGSAPDIGALEYGKSPFVAGALVREQDIENLVITQDSIHPEKVTISGFPIGRFPTENFSIRFANNAASDNVYSILDNESGRVTAYAELKVEDLTGDQSLYLSIDGVTYKPLNQEINTDGVMIDSVDVIETENLLELTISGQRFSSQNYYKTRLSIEGDFGNNAELVILDAKTLVEQGKIKEDLSDIRFVDNAGNEYDYWIESGTNLETTYIWIKKPDILKNVLEYGSEDSIYMLYGNPEWENKSNLAKVHPELANANLILWLKGHELLLEDGAPIAEWNDLSGYSNNVTQSDPASMPHFVANELNGFAGVYFDGSMGGDDKVDYLYAGDLGVSPATGFVVYKNPEPNPEGAAAQNYQRLLSSSRWDEQDNRWDLDYTGTGFYLMTSNDGATPIPIPQGNVVVARSNDPVHLSNFHIGTNNRNYYNSYRGSILEVIFFNEALTNDRRNAVTNYLNQKYRLGNVVRFTFDEHTTTAPSLIQINGEACETYQIISANKITCSIPLPIEHSNYNITIINPDGSSYTLYNAFKHIDEQISLDKTFEDIKDHWARREIEILASKLIIKGKSDQVFDPQGKITRAEIATLFVRAIGYSGLDVDNKDRFSDVTNQWFASDVHIAADVGIARGYGGKFRPYDPVTREELIVMAVNALKIAGVPVNSNNSNEILNEFVDSADLHNWSKDSLAIALHSGIVKGNEKRQLLPGNTTTRAEAATVILRVLNYMEFR